jgi:LacI family transcriptional regulator
MNRKTLRNTVNGVVPRATLAVVARHAGVSVATASKVLNARQGVAEETRVRVRASMAALGYRPTTARADGTPVGIRRITAVFTEIDASMYVPQVLDALLAGAPRFGLEIIPHVLRGRDDPADLGQLLGGGSRGAIMVATHLSQAQSDAYQRLGLPVVAIDCYSPQPEGLVRVGANNFAGGQMAAQHLSQLGHRVIGLVRGPDDASFARERAYGFMAGLSEAGLVVPDGLSIEEPFDYEAGLRSGRLMLDQARRPTAIAANCDGCAIGVMEAARQLGLRVPEDLSVVGFDDTKLAVWSTPQLTTVNQPLADMARVALRMMNRMLDGQAPDSSHVQLATRLVVRGSTAPPPGPTRA